MLQKSVFCCAAAVLFILPVLTFSGCGGHAPYSIVSFEGTATFKGQPLEHVILTFAVGDMRESSAVVISGGKFKAIHSPQFDGVPVGKCTVRVAIDSAAIDAKPSAEQKELLEKYGMDSKGLEIDVTKPDKNFKLNFE